MVCFAFGIKAINGNLRRRRALRNYSPPGRIWSPRDFPRQSPDQRSPLLVALASFRQFGASFPIFPTKSWSNLEIPPQKTPHLAPVLFISSFGKAVYKYFNNFGPWTADVQGPLLNSCLMNVVMTTSAAFPAPIRAPRRHARAAHAAGPASNFNLKFLVLFPAHQSRACLSQYAQIIVNKVFNKLTN